MIGQDAELEQLRLGIIRAALLERGRPAWSLDKRGSTRRALKYRRGAGEILIVNHDGRGWWDPHSSAKGDVFDLVRFLESGLNFRQVRQVLRPLIGITPTFPEALRQPTRPDPDQPVAERWARRSRLRRGSRAWDYLTTTRGLSSAVLAASEVADAVREGPYGSSWFAHRDDAGRVCLARQHDDPGAHRSRIGRAHQRRRRDARRRCDRLRDMCPAEPFRTDADQAGWRSFESGAGRNDTPYRDAKPFSAWYDWRAGYNDRAHLHSQP